MKDIFICIENTCPETISDIDISEIESICMKVINGENVNSADVNIIIVGDEDITALKKEYFDIDQTTDVISFNVSDDQDSNLELEIVVNAELAARECKKNNFPPKSELILYIVHGLLHQLGYDDQTEDEYIKMHNRENQILEELGIGKVFGTPKW